MKKSAGRTLLALGLASLLAWASATTGTAQFGAQGTKNCPHAYSASQAYQVSSQVEQIDASAQLQCVVPKSDGAIDVGASTRTTYKTPSKTQYPTPPGPTDPCNEYWSTGVTLDPPGPARLAHWSSPPGSNIPSSASVADGQSADFTNTYVAVEYASLVAGENTMSIDFVYHGFGDGVDWNCTGGSWQTAYNGACAFGGGLAKGYICAHVQLFGKVTGTSPEPPDPAPFLKPQLAQLTRMIVAGEMGTSPTDTTRQFVNLPDCWWLNGTKPNQAFQLTIDDPPNLGAGAYGRGLVYTYRIDVGLQRVQWNYGDGATYDGDAGYPYTGGGCSNPHTYERVSTLGNPGAVPCPATYPHPTSDDGCYEVQATETYSASITASWYDGVSNQVIPMGDMAPFQISAPPTYIRVLQIEGVPVTP